MCMKSKMSERRLGGKEEVRRLFRAVSTAAHPTDVSTLNLFDPAAACRCPGLREIRNPFRLI